MKWLSAITALCICALWGYSKSRAIAVRARLMRCFGEDSERICHEIKHRPRELTSILRCLEGGELWGFWQRLIQASCCCERAEQAWRQAAEEWSGFASLCEREREILLCAGQGLGNSPTEQQLAAFRRAAEAALERADALEAEQREKGSIFTRVGILMGLGAALLLI